MARILACIDGSSYASAVCDYAAWLTGHFTPEISLLHVVEPDPEREDSVGDSILADAVSRLRDSGLEQVQPILKAGAFVDTASALAPDHAIVVLGKRGAHADHDRAALGGHVAPLIARTQTPICVVSSLFLPVSRVLVLLDADPAHRRTVEFLRRQPWLAQMETDVVVVGQDGTGASKLDWARTELGAAYADIYPLAATGLNAALTHYARDRAADLLVMSREVLVGDCAPGPHIAPDGVWSWRAPILVC